MGNCVVAPWGGWGRCSKTSETGSQARTWAIQKNAAYGGAACPTTSERRNCNTGWCPAYWKTSAAPGCNSYCQRGAYYSTGSVYCTNQAGTRQSDSYCTRRGKGKPGAPRRYCGAGPRCGCNNILCPGQCCVWLIAPLHIIRQGVLGAAQRCSL